MPLMTFSVQHGQVDSKAWRGRDPARDAQDEVRNALICARMRNRRRKDLRLFQAQVEGEKATS